MDKITYRTQGTCSQIINVDIENNIIKDIQFLGGCNGNLKGISALCVGLDINDVISKLKGITCGNKNTSCPDQLANCLIAYIEEVTNKVRQ